MMCAYIQAKYSSQALAVVFLPFFATPTPDDLATTANLIFA